MNTAARKRMAAEAAAKLVENGMLVGLGTGSTAEIVIDILAERARHGLSITCVPTSLTSAERARAGGLTVLPAPPPDRAIDLTIDGADEIEIGSLNLIKGLGGALLWEKIVAAASHRLVIIADDSKLVPSLGQRAQVPLPVEVVPFGWERTAARIAALGITPVRRLIKADNPFRTDSGHFILDCALRPGMDTQRLEADLSATVGVVETGLFIGMAELALIGTDREVRALRRGAAGD